MGLGMSINCQYRTLLIVRLSNSFTTTCCKLRGGGRGLFLRPWRYLYSEAIGGWYSVSKHVCPTTTLWRSLFSQM